jgi:cysteine synthase A
VIKSRNPRVKVFVVEPAECPLLSAERWGTHGVPGIADGIIPENLDISLLDGVVTISTATALKTAYRLARVEGILCGPSSGLNVAASLRVAEAHPEFGRIITTVADTGQRYLSGELFGERPYVDIPDRRHVLDPLSLERLRAHRSRLEFIQEEGTQGDRRGTR